MKADGTGARIFFDTEFIEDGKTIELISIALVREDGPALYLENLECDLTPASDWVKTNVFPHLKTPIKSTFMNGLYFDPEAKSDCALKRADIAKKVIEFVGPKPEFWAYFADYDWVVLCQLYGRMVDLPKGFPYYCRDVKQEMDRLGIKKDMVEAIREANHDALVDALWCKSAWQLCQRKQAQL